ncbi:ribose-5-phosphate isomerase [Auriculariales sp. MPI-PUGE-AT-0066]|nr:ribose-5-phosphate isomerase [Auriculariales sp. MPI-PUGE-AT-0066]
MSAGLSSIETAKRLAAYTAVEQHVLPNHRVIGIGSGSTVPYVVERIVQQGEEVNKNRVFIPTGFQSKNLIVAHGLVLGDIEQYPEIDVTIDGADECVIFSIFIFILILHRVDDNLNCIKGGGGCQYREKVLAEAANTFILVADYRKKSHALGTNWKKGIPIEVVSFGYTRVQQQLKSLGAHSSLELRMAGAAKAGPVVTDNGNFIIDAIFDAELMAKPSELLQKLKALTGVVEVGLFCGVAKSAYYGMSYRQQDGSVSVHSADGKREEIAAHP